MQYNKTFICNMSVSVFSMRMTVASAYIVTNSSPDYQMRNQASNLTNSLCKNSIVAAEVSVTNLFRLVGENSTREKNSLDHSRSSAAPAGSQGPNPSTPVSGPHLSPSPAAAGVRRRAKPVWCQRRRSSQVPGREEDGAGRPRPGGRNCSDGPLFPMRSRPACRSSGGPSWLRRRSSAALESASSATSVATFFFNGSCASSLAGPKTRC
jgi:hypothetical protein